MNRQDQEMLEVEVVLSAAYSDRDDEAIEILRQHGLHVTDVKRDDGVVSGTLPASRLEEVRKLDIVTYIRPVFSYWADYEDDAGTQTPGP